jgi:hypothetical protein
MMKTDTSMPKDNLPKETSQPLRLKKWRQEISLESDHTSCIAGLVFSNSGHSILHPKGTSKWFSSFDCPKLLLGMMLRFSRGGP